MGTVKERVLTLLPKFEIYKGERYAGSICREFSFLTPRYDIDYNGWHIEGDFLEWDYTIVDRYGNVVAEIGKELFHWTDTYVLDIRNPGDALDVLMFVLAVDAEKCSRS